ncbi:hypothetical protein [Nitrosomonas sp. Nm132]|uniref:hypothetical protein n=1 Tax=Nitrosomonas sp. Nm132 TaxID=1881053 RepID=UPI00088C55C3|nr:hypothetical protein [Nitrosomonas sp. Nm132]SDH26859.1 hypothetical protein SAMN05428952_100960 [Nitrosomonas sp. Nm132]
MTTLLIDIGPLSEHQSDEALEAIYKSVHDHGGDDSIWNPHESPYIRRLIELFTERGLTRLEKVRTELTAWAKGEKHRKDSPVPRPEGMIRRWDKGELALVKLYLEALPPEQFTLDDWGMVVDFLVQRYLPEDELRTEAEWLATRSGLMGKVQANMQKSPNLKQADRLLAAMPNTVKGASKQFKLSSVQHAVLDFGRARAAEAVTRLSDNVRHKMRDVIMQHEEQKMLNGGAATPGSALKTRLLDEFAVLNRDWRRIALTEAGEVANQGFIASLSPGAKVKRIEQYRGACPFCRKIDGVVMEVVPASKDDKDPDKMIWVGKNNVERSGSPRKRVGGELVERLPEEQWWVPAGVAHPMCRGQWIKLSESRADDDPDFAEWLKNTLEKK